MPCFIDVHERLGLFCTEMEAERIGLENGAHRVGEGRDWEERGGVNCGQDIKF